MLRHLYLNSCWSIIVLDITSHLCYYRRMEWLQSSWNIASAKKLNARVRMVEHYQVIKILLDYGVEWIARSMGQSFCRLETSAAFREIHFCIWTWTWSWFYCENQLRRALLGQCGCMLLRTVPAHVESPTKHHQRQGLTLTMSTRSGTWTERRMKHCTWWRSFTNTTAKNETWRSSRTIRKLCWSNCVETPVGGGRLQKSGAMTAISYWMEA